MFTDLPVRPDLRSPKYPIAEWFHGAGVLLCAACLLLAATFGACNGPLVDSTPQTPAGAPTWVRVAVGGDFSLGIKSDGTLWAWGFNAADELGDGTFNDHPRPEQIGTGSSAWKEIAAGNDFGLALRTDGSLWAWGDNGAGEVGCGACTLFTGVPIQVTPGLTYVAITAGVDHSMAIRSDGTLWAWGDDSQGELGNAAYFPTSSPVPVQVDAPNTYRAISAGYDFSLGIRTDGTLYSWGFDSVGQLGNNTFGAALYVTTPTQIDVTHTYVAVSAGDQHALGIQTDGTLWTWGLNTSGQLGQTPANPLIPTQLGPLTTWVQVVGGVGYSLARKSDSTVWAWGDDLSGELGNALYYPGTSPTPVQVGPPLTGWTLIAVDNTNTQATLGIQSNGTLWAWGSDSNDQLGDGTFALEKSPIQQP